MTFSIISGNTQTQFQPGIMTMDIVMCQTLHESLDLFAISSQTTQQSQESELHSSNTQLQWFPFIFKCKASLRGRWNWILVSVALEASWMHPVLLKIQGLVLWLTATNTHPATPTALVSAVIANIGRVIFFPAAFSSYQTNLSPQLLQVINQTLVTMAETLTFTATCWACCFTAYMSVLFSL